MDDKTLAALRGSIVKWEAIVAGTGEDHGADNCPLCRMFLYSDDGLCSGCPVADRTGEIGCAGSPYEAWDETNIRGTVKTEADRALAQAELDFLRSLLPDGMSEHEAAIEDSER